MDSTRARPLLLSCWEYVRGCDKDAVVLLEVSGMIENQRWVAFETQRKSRVTAYLLWLLLGVTGAHRFYLRMKVSGFGMLFLACLATVAFFSRYLLRLTDEMLTVAGAALLVLTIWVLVDVFRIPGFVQDYNDRLLRRLGGESEQWRRRRPNRRDV